MIDFTQPADGALAWARIAGTGDAIIFTADEMRRERTGFHARITIGINAVPLAYDTFNIGRSEERQRLAKAAQQQFGELLTEEYPLHILRHDLDIFCHDLPEFYEESRIEEDSYEYEVGDEVPSQSFILNPYVIKGGGTILYAPPGTGKSYVLMTMGVCIGAGRKDFWPVLRYPVYLINLERSAESVRRRIIMLSRAMGLLGRQHNMTFLNARGMSLTTIYRKAKAFSRRNPECVVLLDSISRAGQGPLNEDETANRIIDMLNSLGQTWVAVGHAPRASADHIFGSVHFDAGADIAVKITSETRGETLGVSLAITKANDTGKHPPSFLAFDFQQEELKRVRSAENGEFPQLLIALPKSDEQKIIDYLAEETKSTATKIATATNVDRTNASTILKNSPLFVRLGRDKEGAWYGLKEDRE